MREPAFLSIEEVEQLHEIGLKRWGGAEGVRDRGAFESAVIHPQNVYYYEQGDVFDIAAAYCFHIAQAQAFLDGNKRTAVAAGIIFLDLNGYEVSGDEMKIYEGLIAIAKHEMDKNGLAALLRAITHHS